MISVSNLRILILDDEQLVRDELSEFLIDPNFQIFKASTPSEAFEIMNRNEVHIAIVDVNLPEMSGLDVLERIKKEHSDIEVIMISGYSEMDSVIHSMRLGASDFFTKPFRLRDVEHSIERTKKFVNLNKSLQEVKRNYSIISKEFYEAMGYEIVGESRHMKNLINLIGKVAKTENTSVLITGESGTGKELVARAIHYLSSRKENCFYAVNCSAIPETLFESEFFGHTKGAFTGASDTKTGWFEAANKGTLFLDEIGDMQLNLQTKFLRVLEDRKIRKVGSNIEIPFDTRIIAATNQNLEELSTEKGFRLDLYHRISSFVIHLEPLRNRKEDIPLLLDYFVKYFNRIMAKNINEVDEVVVRKLLAYEFPGNVRELKNMVERAVIICDTNKLGLSHFQLNEIKENYSDHYHYPSEEILDLELVEKNCILKALERSNYNKSKAADLLNITWQSLDRRIKKYKIEK
ncbi:sigma-54-dependent transcriptional regulator [Marinifilum flexuosum]|uniref:Two component Fis family sigma54 specific transcriptional regulator n=1 Tax=Marinifilum flexuosum TaxID=1117708 RepID=A0A419X3J3_9BACT|nr:sigma-54 dependent transcriptional regulator [Marinifilum flexuosum]RKE02180.1 two component Fis family sigma54 specific transcriptional regulator [Marinifilum flexuosum]